ncbi:MAG: RsmD family RNA methyltransferase [Bacteroidaceae bacterium]|nr:RsmD family RNA methyltransferase [Bacteroidaceae bacterium]
MRVISGKYKHRHFEVPRSFKARPTTDFAKENLFNILQNVYVDFDDQPTVLDLFAGTGSMSLEFLSRGCAKVVSVEKDRRHYQFISRVAQEIGDKAWTVAMADVFKYLQHCHDRFDIIFADPPYALPTIADLPPIVLQSGLLADDGLFILEHGKTNNFANFPHLIDHREYGSVNFSFFQRQNEENDG